MGAEKESALLVNSKQHVRQCFRVKGLTLIYTQGYKVWPIRNAKKRFPVMPGTVLGQAKKI
jgi:hypothetical protein